MPRYRITHTTLSRHATAVTSAWQVLHLQPRAEANQECSDFKLEISPRPSDLDSRADYFANTVHQFSLQEPHRELSICSKSVVVRGEPAVPMAGLTPPVAECRKSFADSVAKGEFDLEQYKQPSPRVPLIREARALAEGLDADDPTILAWVTRLGERFREQFVFDPSATVVSTPLTHIVSTRRGVCQDFAHLFISCARCNGIPAAYVSGYIHTRSAEGRARLAGADASHAWVSVFVPGTGWIDYDPTNHCFAGSGHVVVARGRDYGDVSPTRGVFSGGGRHLLTIGVTVESADAAAG
jgi:transglutaminase-like putative cysteine protease